MLIDIPSSSGKTGLSDLVDIPRFDYTAETELLSDSALYSFKEDEFVYDFLLVKKQPSVNRLFVLFSGAAVGEHLTPPVFQRWKWAEKFPGHCLYISDPTIRLKDNFKLAWYAGTPEHEPMQVIANLVTSIAAKLKVDATNVFSYGSSGGGYASIRLGAFLPDIAMIAVNPQTDITKYHRQLVEKFLKICFNGLGRQDALAQFPHKMDLAHHAERIKTHRLIYVQNELDTHHCLDHQPILFNALGLQSGESKGNVTYIPFSHEGGHTKAESPEVFTRIIQRALSY